MTTLRPDNVSVINTFTGNAEPYTLDINTHIGHNGLIHIDYDNFVLKKCRFVPQRNTYICLEKIDPNEPGIRITPTFP